METKKLIICLFFLFISSKTFAQVNNDSVVNIIDPMDKERSDSPGIQWRKISKKDLLAVKHIEELLPEHPTVKNEVVSCKVTFDGDNVPYFEYDIKGNEFSEAVIGNIEKSPEGTKIMIEFIKTSLPDGNTRLLNPVTLLLTE
ncbi:MAG TPA: hypothetical protein VJY62_21855 [Bacteroidia bacterium]|nr:hypothetical protein [Bacteroidia bacterium]